MGTIQATSTTPAPPFAQRQLAARDSIVNYLALLKNWNETRFAVAGNGSGVVDVPGSVNRIYARLDSASGPVAEARVTLLAPANNDVVLLRREQPGWLGGWLMLDWYGPGTPPLEQCVGCALTFATRFELANWTPFAGQLALVGNILYAIISGESNGITTYFAPAKLKIIDISDFNNPQLLSSTAITPLDGSSKAQFTGLATDGTFAWLGLFISASPDNYSELQVYNVSNAAAPAFVGRIQYAGAADQIISERIGLLSHQGSVYGAYVVTEQKPGLLDDERTVYLADSTPAVVSSIFEGLGFPQTGVIATKEHVFVAGGNPGSIHLTSVNFESLAGPFIAFQSPIPGNTFWPEPIGLDKSGDYLYTGVGSSSSRVFNITDPDVENVHQPGSAMQQTMTTLDDCTYTAGGLLQANNNARISPVSLADPLEPDYLPISSSVLPGTNVMDMVQNSSALFVLGAQGFNVAPSGYAGKKTYLTIYAKS